jgi:hypothetical protein
MGGETDLSHRIHDLLLLSNFLDQLQQGEESDLLLAL